MEVEKLLDRSDELMHYGTPRHSGRYPWGSGERPFQGDGFPQGVKITKKGKIEITTSGNAPREVNPDSEDAAKQLAMHLVSIDPEAMKEFNKNFSKNLEKTANVYQSVVDDKYKGTVLPKRDPQTESLSDYEARLSKMPGKELAYYAESEAAMDNAWRDTWRVEYSKMAKKKLPEAERFLEENKDQFKPYYKKKAKQAKRSRNAEMWKHDMKRHALETGAGLAAAGVMAALMLSDEGNTEELYHDDPIGALADRADVLIHMGKAHEGNIPHSGRYPWGSGERPRQRERVHLLPANTSSGNGGVPAASKKSYNRTSSSGKIPPRSRKTRYYDGPDLGTSRSNKSRYENDAEGKKKYNKQIKFGEEAIKEAIKQAREEGKEDGELSFDDRMKLEDQYFKQVDAMGSTLESMYKHARNLKAAKQKVKNPAKKMSDEKLKEVTDRLRLENAYLKALSESNSYTARPDKGENAIGLIRDIGKMGTTFGRMYNLNQKRLK